MHIWHTAFTFFLTYTFILLAIQETRMWVCTNSNEVALTPLAGRAPQKRCNCKKKKKILNILCVDWSIADLVMVHCGSNPFPVYGIFTPSQQSRKNHMVKCCLIYGKCINAKRLFFFSERMLWISSSVSGWILLMCKDIMNSAEDVKSHFNLFKRVTCGRLLFLKDNLKVAKIYGHEIITGTNGVNNYWPICM